MQNENDFLDPTLPDQTRPSNNTDREGNFSYDDSNVGSQIGRYQLMDKLGQGSFGVVYRAKDEALERFVAIKILTRFSSSAQADAWIEEARVLASLDHPSIVPVYDVGKSERGQPFIVSKLVDGGNLAKRSVKSDWTMEDSIRVITQLAGALDYLHRKGVMHRDIKPSNILTTATRDAVLVDFGLALPEANIGRGSRFVGTPAYMSPEQARYEGHRVDGRSDIYSLGVVFYELLTGTRPFTAKDQEELLECIRSLEVRPLRQINSLVPKELERICLKSLSKRASDRYSTAADLVDDLAHWHTAHSGSTDALGLSRVTIEQAPAPGSSTVVAEHTTKSIDIETVGVVPHGLRPFEKADADFFKHLLPGARDRQGIPDSLSFWLSRIENRSTESTFRVGVLMGPSGSGKSSLMRAGVLPLVSGIATSVLLEARPNELEKDLFKAIQQKYPQYAAETDLRELLIRIRSNATAQRPKLLIVIDQFEQWLNYHREIDSSPLHEALRQCDGVNIQAILLVRDDFLLGLSNFMEQLDESLLQKQNFATIEPFGVVHGRKVLAAFGRAFGTVSHPITAQQEQFVNEAIDNLAKTGRLQPVHIALFSEMVKNKSWAPATLRELGGIEGLEVAFLEERLAGASAHPLVRAHLPVVERILKELLPTVGTVIKPPACPQSLLLERLRGVASEELLGKLLNLIDTEVRLITPTSNLNSSVSGSASNSSAADPAYQLTHDHLVITIRRWLESRSMSTRSGRAAEQLREISAMWNLKPSAKRLPTILEWATINWFVPKSSWSAPDSRMMRSARNRFGLIVVCVSFVFLSIYSLVSYWANNRHARELAVRLLEAKNEELVPLLNEVSPKASAVLPFLNSLSQDLKESEKLHSGRFRISLAELAISPTAQHTVLENISSVDNRCQMDLVRYLAQHQSIDNQAVSKYAISSLESKSEATLAQIALLCQRSAEDKAWPALIPKLASYLLEHDHSELKAWANLLLPIRQPLVDELLRQVESKILAEQADTTESSSSLSQQNLAILLVILARENAAVLARGIQCSPAKSLPAIVAACESTRELAVELRTRLSQATFFDQAQPLADAQISEMEKAYAGQLFRTGGWLERLPIDSAQECVDVLAKYELIPNTVRAYKADGKWILATTWKPGTSSVEIKLDLSDKGIEEEFEAKKKAGFAMIDFCSYGTPAQWLAIWHHNPVQAATQLLHINKTAESRIAQSKGFVMLRYQQRTIPDEQPTYDVLWGESPLEDADNIYWSRLQNTSGDLYPGLLQADLRSQLSYADKDRASAWFELSDAAGKSDSPQKNLLMAASLCRLGNYQDALDQIAETSVDQLSKSEQRSFWKSKARILWLLGKRDELEKLAESSSVDPRELELIRIAAAVLRQDKPAVNSLIEAFDTGSLKLVSDRNSYLRLLGFVSSQFSMPEQASMAQKMLMQLAGEYFRDGSNQQDVLLDADFDHLRGQPEWDQFVSKLKLTRRYSSCHHERNDLESKLLLAEPSTIHAQRATQLLSEGYLPTVWNVDGEGKETAISSVWSRPIRSEAKVRYRADQISALVLALGRLGEIDVIQDGLGGKWGTTVQTSLIGSCSANISSGTLLSLLKSSHVQLQVSLLSALATYKQSDFDDSDLKYLRLRLSDWILSSKDVTLLNMARYCAAQFGEGPQKELPPTPFDESRNWFVNTSGQQFAVIDPPSQCAVGKRGEVRRINTHIGRVYAIATTEVTANQFQPFVQDPRFQKWQSADPRNRGIFVEVQGEFPQMAVSWFVAMQFCQWLNEREQIPEDQWCYKNVWCEDGEYPVAYSNYLNRTGYRLPTMAEWSWAACAGNAEDSWHFGRSSKWHELFEWTAENSKGTSHRSGALRPNGFGLFDTGGNLSEWTDSFDARPARSSMDSAIADVGSPKLSERGTTTSSIYVIKKGGNFRASVSATQHAESSLSQPMNASLSSGFRLAKTLRQQ